MVGVPTDFSLASLFPEVPEKNHNTQNSEAEGSFGGEEGCLISILAAQNARAGRLLEIKRNAALCLLRQLSETGRQGKHLGCLYLFPFPGM